MGVDAAESTFEPLVDLLHMLLRQVDVLTSEFEAGTFLVIYLVVNKLVDELDDGGASSVVRLARLEPVALL